MNIWIPLFGESLRCRNDVENEHDVHAVAFEKENSNGQPKLIGHVSLLHSKVISTFLTLPNTSVQAQMIAERIN